MKSSSKRAVLAPVAMAVISFCSGLAIARAVDGTCDDCGAGHSVPLPSGTQFSNSSTPTIFNNTDVTVTIAALGTGSDAPPIDTTNWFTDLFFGKPRDLGDWLCTACSVTTNADGDTVVITAWAEFITTVVNPQFDGGPQGRWKDGDTLAICDGGGMCVILEWHPGGTHGWLPTTKKFPIKLDLKKYKNKSLNGAVIRDAPLMVPLPISSVGQPGLVAGYIFVDQIITDRDLDACKPQCVTAPPPSQWPTTPPPPPPPAPPPPPPSGGGGGGGNSCVHVESRLPDGRRAGDVRVGDAIQLGDESTADLKTGVGIVTYSKTVAARGFRITTQSGITLLCSDTAPIWTDEGFVRAPDLLGKRVATRVDGASIVTRFEKVEVVAEVGMIDVQHISVGDRAFWAGAESGTYILHHNKYVPDED